MKEERMKDAAAEEIPVYYTYNLFCGKGAREPKTMELEKAVERAVDACIKKGVLKEFLIEQKAEVIAMSIYEYNEEYVKRTLFEDGMEAGYDKGKADGYAEGEAKGEAKTLVKNVEAAMKNFHMSLQEACEGLGTTIEEYEKAKEIGCLRKDME